MRRRVGTWGCRPTVEKEERELTELRSKEQSCSGSERGVDGAAAGCVVDQWQLRQGCTKLRQGYAELRRGYAEYAGFYGVLAFAIYNFELIAPMPI
ncbi:hypothetical protein Syun_000841 [Stephania yunnanensis]|uniref:Uncharacterized protein n=1 Tax=Stephania yunnanensis TaxID=152371 RepID=A0AAP0QAA6_9MAGN